MEREEEEEEDGAGEYERGVGEADEEGDTGEDLDLRDAKASAC